MAELTDLPLYPDEILDKVGNEIAYNQGKLLLSILLNKLNLKTDSMKMYIIKCCLEDQDILFFNDINDSEPCDKSILINDLKNNGVDDDTSIFLQNDKIAIGIADDKLWLILTGYKKKQNPIGQAAFELLLNIATNGAKGTNTSLLAKDTGQDSRSITGRLKKINHLITTSQILFKGHVVKKIIYNKFLTKEEMNQKDNFINVRDYLGKIVEIVKNSKNGIRQTSDLKRELKFDKDRRLDKSFIAAMTYLSERGHLRKIFVSSPKNPDFKVRCVQYLSDYVENNGTSTATNNNSFDDIMSDVDDIDNDNEDIEADVDADMNDDEDDTIYENLDTSNATTTTTIEKLPKKENEMLINNFYTLQNQTYNLVEKTGENGLSIIDSMKYLCGRDYQRAYSKNTEIFIDTISKKSKKVANDDFKLVKIYDFEGKKKFCRVYTNENFQKITGNSIDSNSRGLFKPLKVQKNSLEQLNKKNFVPLNTTVRFGFDENQKEVFFWNGENINHLTFKEPTKKPRLTKTEKRKIEAERIEKELNENKKAKIIPTVDNSDQHKIKIDEQNKNDEADEDDKTKDNEQHYYNVENAKDKELSDNKNGFTINGFSGFSLVALRRQRAILEVLRKFGGFSFMKDTFFDAISRYMGVRTLVDKKTIKRDLTQLVADKKVILKEDDTIKRRYVYLPSLSEEEVEIKLFERNSKRPSSFTDVVKNTDLYFFDKKEKERFDGELKRTQRLRKYIKKNRATAGILDDTSIVTAKKKVAEKKSNLKSLSKKKSKSPEPQLPKFTLYLDKDGVNDLVKIVVIMKSITNELNWDTISGIYPKNSTNYIKKKWFSKRMKMGHSGWKVLIQKWRKILVNGIKKEIVTMENVENLDIPVLLKLWADFEKDTNHVEISLFKNYAENKKKYIFASNAVQRHTQTGSVKSSMVQRETFLLKEAFTNSVSSIVTDEDKKLIEYENSIRSIIRSILIEKTDTAPEEIDILKDIPKDVLDKVIMDMANDKQIFLHHSKLALTSVAKEHFGEEENMSNFKNAAIYSAKLKEFCDAKIGVIITSEINDFTTWSLIDLIERRKVELNVIPIARNQYRFHYSSRKFEIETLTPPLIVTPSVKDLNLYDKPKHVDIPMGKPFSKLWIDSNGALRDNIWKHSLCYVLHKILFSPGINLETLADMSSQFLCINELHDICDWLVKKSFLKTIAFDGFMVTDNWYRLLA